MTAPRFSPIRAQRRSGRRPVRTAARAGKTDADENFPVGSWLIRADLRPDVRAYYRFARAADDIADHPTLSEAEKLARLTRLEIALRTGAGDDAAAELGRRLARRRIDLAVATDLLTAFRRDAGNRCCATLRDLDDYCRFSAAPVGRFLLALHGERNGVTESDALCAALQILNHVQDCREDYLRLDRVYLPLDWLAAAEGADILGAETATPPLRAVIDRVLDHADTLLDAAAPLPGLLSDGGLRREAGVILHLARRLSARLRREDPLADKVKLSAWDWVAGTLRGVAA